MSSDKQKAKEEKGATPLDQEYYDKAYFETGSKKIVDNETGKEKVWGYMGTDWSGNYLIVHGILKTFKGEVGSLLDIGAGQGSFTDYALRAGLRAKGYDFSEFAVNTAHHYAKGHIHQADVSEGINEPDESYDLVFSSDLLEHIKKSREPKVISEFYRITKRWVFLQFPIVDKEEDVFNAEIHGEDHPLYAHFMIAGHLNMERREWWDKLFTDTGFTIREDLVVDFRVSVPREVIKNWMNIVILEKK